MRFNIPMRTTTAVGCLGTSLLLTLLAGGCGTGIGGEVQGCHFSERNMKLAIEDSPLYKDIQMGDVDIKKGPFGLQDKDTKEVRLGQFGANFTADNRYGQTQEFRLWVRFDERSCGIHGATVWEDYWP